MVPLVSIIIPTFNREDTILKSVESALGQTYRELEVIVVDDGSTDRTVERLGVFGDRIRIVRQENAGPSAARNAGVAVARGEIVSFLDSDDEWLPEKISRQVALMDRAGDDMTCCVCNATVYGEEGERVGDTFGCASIAPGFTEGEWTNPLNLLATRFLLFNQVFAVRKREFERVGGYDSRLWLLEDYELSMRLANSGRWGVIRDTLVVKRNGTRGLGVECMNDVAKHAEALAVVLRGILADGYGLESRAMNQVRARLSDAMLEMAACGLSGQEGMLNRVAGRALLEIVRIRKGLRRRSRAWPRFEGRPL